MRHLSFVLLFFLFSSITTFCQEFKKPSEGKSLIYFVRYSSTGALINFKYFDGDKYLGKINGTNYVIYECEPGEHTFWVASENRDFIKGNLKPDATYIIEVKPTMGAFKAAVRLYPVLPEEERILKRVNKLISKKEPSELKGQEEDMTFFIKNGLERYNKIQNDIPSLNPDKSF